MIKLLASAALVLTPAAALAATITDGFTFAVASDGIDNSVGNHFHSNTGGAFGNPAGKAEVGRFFSEEVRGLSEYDLTGLAAAADAFVTFTVFKEGGLFDGENDTPFTGTISVVAYAGNNAEDISDYQAASIGTVGSFFVSPATVDVGDVFSFNITTIFNQAIADGATSLGIRLEQDPLLANSEAWTFDLFRLTSDDQTSDIPTPATLALFGLAAGALVARRARRA